MKSVKCKSFIELNEFEKKLRHDYLLNKYNEWETFYNHTIMSFDNEFIRHYVHCFHTRVLSFHHLKKFVDILKQLRLTPDFNTFETVNNENELFDADLILLIKRDQHELEFNIPMPINISKLAYQLMVNKFVKQEVPVTYLKSIINPDCFDEFDQDMQYIREGRAMLDSIKAPNPLILMTGSEIARPYLINGNHRVIQAIRDGKNTVKVYVVSPELCCHFSLTKDYVKLYDELILLYKKVYGVVK